MLEANGTYKDEGTEYVPVMYKPNLLSSKSSMSILSVGPPLSLSGFKNAAVAWLSMELPVLYRTYNLHTIVQLEEMNFATTK